jgi:predicted phosphohydrolase
MKIVALSDTHSYHRKVEVPDGDVLIHAGDITWRGELEIIADFSNWLKDLPHKHKICIFGNHELFFRSGPNRGVAIQMIENSGATYLENSGIKIDDLNFWGSPATPYFNDWEWNYQRGADIGRIWAQIPDDTNVLITHGPPNGILDKVRDSSRGPQGCEMLKKRVMELPNLKAHIFGHLHMNGGQTTNILGVQFVNAAICDDAYNTSRQPMVINL